jgi:hypothetical protein
MATRTGFRLPNQDLDLPERDRTLDPEDLHRRFVDVGEQVEENFRAIQGSPQFGDGAIWQEVPQARVYNNANISIADATTTALTFNTERYDTGVPSEQHSTSTNTGRLTCVRPGLYQIGCAVAFDANATGHRFVSIRLNGSTIIAQDGRMAVTTASIGTSFAPSTEYRLASGDYAEVTVLQNSGGALNVLALGNYSPEFYWHWVSP